MKPLIEITTVPIQIEMKTTHAKLEYARGTAEMEMRRDEGGLSIKSRNAKVNIDTYEARNSITPTLARSLEQNAQKGQQAAYSATAAYVDDGKMMMETKWGEEVITQLSKQSLMDDVKTGVGIQFLPSVGPEITWDPAEISIKYEMDKLNFDWKINQGDFEFTPGDIEFTVTQKPEVIVKYIGGPMYVPPSADPDYEPEAEAAESIDVRA